MFKILKKKTWKEVQERVNFLQEKVSELSYKHQLLRIVNENLKDYINFLEERINEYLSKSFPKNSIKHDLNTRFDDSFINRSSIRYNVRLNPVQYQHEFMVTDGDVIKEFLLEDRYFDHVAEQMIIVTKEDLAKELKEHFINEARKDPKIAKIIGRANTDLY